MNGCARQKAQRLSNSLLKRRRSYRMDLMKILIKLRQMNLGVLDDGYFLSLADF